MGSKVAYTKGCVSMEGPVPQKERDLNFGRVNLSHPL